jgi:hypothetical protein
VPSEKQVAKFLMGRAALEQQIVLQAFDAREREDAQLGKWPVRHQDRVPSLGIFEMAKRERMAVRLEPTRHRPRDNLHEEVRFALDSLVEERGFEPSRSPAIATMGMCRTSKAQRIRRDVAVTGEAMAKRCRRGARWRLT